MVSATRTLRALADLVAAVLITVAIPVGLVELSLHQPSGRAVWVTMTSATLFVIATASWAMVLWRFLASVWDHLHYRGTYDSRFQRFAGRIAVVVSLTFAMSSTAGATVASSRNVRTAMTSVVGHEQLKPPLVSHYTVRDGDCLWTIAEALYGDGRKYVAILDANFGQMFGRGERFDNPRIIRTGWVLAVPDVTAHPSPQLAPASSSADPAEPRPRTTPEHIPERISTAVVAPPGPASRRTTHAQSSSPSLHVGAVAPRSVDDDLLDALGALGLGLIAGAIATRRRHALVDEEDHDSVMSPAAEAALRLGDGVLNGGLVDAVITELERRSRLNEDRGARGATAHSPSEDASERIALVLGRNGATTEVALVQPGEVVTIVGPHRKGLVALQRLLAPTWTGHLSTVATDSPVEAADHVALRDPHTLLYFGAASDLDAEVASQSVIITDEPGGSLTIEVTEDGTIVNGGAALSNLSVPRGLASEVEALLGVDASLDTDSSQLESAPLVRLLTPVPRIDGLAQPLEPKRARRAVELAAYLCLHRPHPVTGGQLRTDVLGDPERDGASKSLSNTVSALRRALGADALGNTHLPPATRSGCYVIAPAVRSDVEAVAEYLAAAEDASGDLALALVRAACECIEGPPLASCVIGYDWFAREGHDHKLARALSRAVARVLDHAIGEGHLDLARMLIERAAFINPYSETLARAAMTLAAASHDVDQLQQEWNQHLERLDTLEPGLAPSAMTEAHYWRLHGICAGLTTP